MYKPQLVCIALLLRTAEQLLGKRKATYLTPVSVLPVAGLGWTGVGGDGGGGLLCIRLFIVCGKIDVLPHGIVSAFFFSYRI